MPWKRVRDAEDWEVGFARTLKRAKLYADEDIEDEIVVVLRGLKVNVLSARDLGNRGKDDRWQAEFARKRGRFLLTKNARDFLDDRKFPLHRGYSVIVVEGDMSNVRAFARAIGHVAFWIVPHGEIHLGSKITVGPDRVSWRFRATDGQVVTERFRLAGGAIERWEDFPRRQL